MADARGKQDQRLEREQQLGQELKTNKKELNEIIASGKTDAKTTKRKAELTKQINKDLKEQKKLKKDIADFTRKELADLDIIQDHANNIQKTLAKQTPSLKKNAEQNLLIADRAGEAASLAQDSLDTTGALGDIYHQAAGNLASMNETDIKLLQNQELIGSSLYDNSQLEQDIKDSKQNLFHLENMYANNREQMSKKERVRVEEVIAKQKAQLEYQEKINLENEVANAQLEEMTGHVTGIFDKFRSFIEMLPGGSLVAAFAMPQPVLDQFKEKVSETFGQIMNGTLDATEGFKMLSKDGIEIATNAWNVLKTSFMGTPLVVTLIAALATFKMIGKSIDYIRDGIDTVGESLGAPGVVMYGKHIREAGIAVTDLGYGIEDVLSLSNSLRNEWGYGAKEAINMSGQVAEISKTYALTVEEGAAVAGMLTTLQGTSKHMVEDAVDFGGALAIANDVAPSAVMKDIAANSDLVATYTKGGAQNIFRMSVAAKKLGMEMSDIDTIAQGLLDVETSMNAEMEFMALTGKQMNMTRARQLALDEDWEGLNKELAHQFGDQAFWANSTRIEKELMAGILNTDIKTMGKIVNQDKERLTLAQAISGTTSMDELLGQNALSNISRLSNQFKKIAATLWETFGPALNWIAGMFAGFFDLLEKFPGVANALRGVLVGLAVAMAALTAKGIIGLFVMAHRMAMSGAMIFGPGAAAAYPVILSGIIAAVWSGLSMAGSAASTYSAMGDGVIPSVASGEAPVITSNVGAFQLSKQDDLIAGPGLAKGGGDSGTKQELQALRQQNGQLIKLMADTKKILNDSLGPAGTLPGKISGGVTKPLLLRNT